MNARTLDESVAVIRRLDDGLKVGWVEMENHLRSRVAGEVAALTEAMRLRGEVVAMAERHAQASSAEVARLRELLGQSRPAAAVMEKG